MNIGISLSVTSRLNSSTSPYAAYALALDFANGEYWSGGTQYGASEGLNRHNFTTLGSAWQSLGDGSYAVNNTGGTASDASSNTALLGLASKRFRLTFTASNVVGMIYAYIGDTNPNLVPVVNGVNTLTVTVVSSNYIWRANPGASATISNIQLVELPGIHQLPGYSFTRSGTQGAIDTDGGVDSFAANVPAINGKGYHAYGALTNITLNSQEFSSWSHDGSIIPVTTSNVVAAPDGTMTADKVTFGVATNSRVTRAHTGAAPGTVHTISVWMRADTPLQLTITTWDGVTTTSKVCAVTTAWQRFVHTYTPAGNNGNWAIQNGESLAKEAYLWQGQNLPGNFPDGGPIIPTTTAAASIGASNLETTSNPVVAETDFFLWVIGDFKRENAGSSDVLCRFGDKAWLGRGAGGALILSDSLAYTAGNSHIGPVVTGGRCVIGVRRRGGKTTAAFKTPVGAVTLNTEGVVAWPLPNTSLDVGCYTGSFQPGAEVEGVFLRTGTFSDAEITAILEAA